VGKALTNELGPLTKRRTIGHDKKILCTTCHDIHQNEQKGTPNATSRVWEPNSKLLRAARCDSTLCVTCHATSDAVLGTPHDLRKSAPSVRNVRGELVIESGPCGICHVVHPATAAAGTWAQRVPPGGKAGEGLCTCCHSQGNCAQTRVPHYVDHPEVALLNRLSPGHAEYMPTLDDHGRPSPTGIISCPTCHQMHATSPQAVSSWKSEASSLPTSNLGSQTHNSAFGGPFPLQTPPAPPPHRMLLRTTHPMLCADCHGMEAPWRFLYYHQTGRNPHRPPGAETPAATAENGTNAPPEF